MTTDTLCFPLCNSKAELSALHQAPLSSIAAFLILAYVNFCPAGTFPNTLPPRHVPIFYFLLLGQLGTDHQSPILAPKTYVKSHGLSALPYNSGEQVDIYKWAFIPSVFKILS